MTPVTFDDLVVVVVEITSFASPPMLDPSIVDVVLCLRIPGRHHLVRCEIPNRLSRYERPNRLVGLSYRIVVFGMRDRIVLLA